MTTPRKKRTRVVSVSRERCPFCNRSDYVKMGGAYHKQAMPGGALSKLFRVKCRCGAKFRLREVHRVAR